MFSKQETLDLSNLRKKQIHDRVVELFKTNNISSREDIVNIGICTDRYLQDHPELLDYLRNTTIKMVEAKCNIKLDMDEINKNGYFSTKSISKQLLYAIRREKMLEIIKKGHCSIKSAARQIPCTPSYLRSSGLSSLIVQ